MYFEQAGKPRFCVGDRVIFRQNIKPGVGFEIECSYQSPYEYGNAIKYNIFKDEFLRKNNFLATIQKVTRDGYYELEGDPLAWCYADCWIIARENELDCINTDVKEDILLDLLGGV